MLDQFTVHEQGHEFSNGWRKFVHSWKNGGRFRHFLSIATDFAL